MGAWGSGPFDNDDAADFLGTLEAWPSKGLTNALRKIASAEPGAYIEIDAGSAGWAACEIVALTFGRSDSAAIDDRVLEIVRRVRPQEGTRLLALSILPRIADRELSELAGLWHEGSDGSAFDAAIDQLASRLRDAASGARALPAPKSGDVFALPGNPLSDGLVVVQVVNGRELAVFDGTYASDAAALLCTKDHQARRVPTSVSKLTRECRLLGNMPVRKDLKGQKLYAMEGAPFEDYYLATALGGGYRSVSYEEARVYEANEFHEVDDLRAVARGARPISRVRSPDEREAAFRAEKDADWAKRRAITTPGPFGDIADLNLLIEWMKEFGVENAVNRFHDEAIGRQMYGRPNEASERSSYAFAGIVALWRGTWRREMWPSTPAVQLPPHPGDELMARAETAARILARRVVTRDAELRLIWDGAPDGGAEFRTIVSSLQTALAE
jgi:hypothetical protein